MTTTMQQIADKQRQRMIEGAKRYAASDRSDPFTFSRAMTHINNGLCAVRHTKDGPVECHYDATAQAEGREYSFNGSTVKYQGTVYKDLVRP
jgi:hypothetical protein